MLIALGLLFDGRYRPLVWPLLAAPASLLLALTVLGDRVDRGAWLERALATVAPWRPSGWSRRKASPIRRRWVRR
ncbi:MAG: hypothetical protein V5B35_05075 [Candidatus Accumulibacter necessarius]